MSFFSWLRNRTSTLAPQGRAQQRTAARRFRPQLEALEDRCLPSTLTVTNNLDSGTGSLRADIAAAQPGDTIVFAPSLDGQTIKLASGQLVLNKSLTIQGPGAGQLAISGGNTWATYSRVFEVYGANTNVTLSGLTITQGNGGSRGGGGILNTAGSSLTISGCTLSNNHASSGGAVYNSSATLQIVNSTLSGNKANDPNGVGEGGGVYSVLGTVSMTGCTLSNDSATSTGGGIYSSGGDTVTVNRCTFSGNLAYGGGGAYVRPTGNDIYNGASASMLRVSDSVFSNNTPYSFLPILGPWTNGGGNTFK